MLAKRFISFSFHPQRFLLFFLLYWRGVHLRFCWVDWCVWLFIIMMKGWNLCLRKIFSGGFRWFCLFFSPLLELLFQECIDTPLLFCCVESFFLFWENENQLLNWLYWQKSWKNPPPPAQLRHGELSVDESNWKRTDSAANGRSFYLSGNGRGFLIFFLLF